MDAPGGVQDEYGQSARSRFFTFLNGFKKEGCTQPHYVQRARDMLLAEQRTLFVECPDLEDFDPQFFDTLKDDYVHLEPHLNQAVHHLVSQLEGVANKLKSGYLVGFFGLKIFEQLRDLKAESIGRLVAFTGTVTRTSEVRPQLHLANFQCRNCNNIAKGVQQDFKLTFPILCSNSTCGNR